MRTIALYLTILLIFFIGWEDLVYIEAIDSSITRIAGPLVIAFWGGMVLITGKIRRIQLFHVLFGLFILWHMLSLVWTIDDDKSTDRLVTFIQLFAFSWLVWDLLVKPGSIFAALQFYVIGLYISASNIIINFIIGQESAYQRFSAGTFDTNDLAVMLVLGMPIAWYLVIYRESPYFPQPMRVINLMYIPLGLLAVTLTAARTAVIALVPVILFISLGLPRLNIWFKLLIGLGIVVVIVNVPRLAPEASLERISTTVDEIQSGTLNGRTIIWAEAIRVIGQQPFLGVGTGAFETAAIETGKPPHNVFLSVFAELGVIGFTLFMVIFGLVLFAALSHPYQESILMCTLLGVWLIGALSLNWEWKKITWILFTLIVTSMYAHFKAKQTSDSGIEAQAVGETAFKAA